MIKKLESPSVLILVLLFPLAVVGVSYGLWSDQVTVSEVVTTGNFDATWLGGVCTEFYTWPEIPVGVEGQGEWEGKDVGRTTFEIDEEDPSIMRIFIENGYPSYAVDCEMWYENSGDIPWIIRGVTIQPVSDNLENCVLTDVPTLTLTCDELTSIFAGEVVGDQIDPNQRSVNSIIIHVEQPADQNTTYEVQVRMCVSNWNEPLTAEECLGTVP